jgi:hypothetical protein
VAAGAQRSLREAFDESVAASAETNPRLDAALVEAGCKIADRIDAAVESGDGPELSKALYLMPHLMNILREMLATPASRQAAGLNAKEGVRGNLGKLRSVNATGKSGRVKAGRSA